MPHRTPSSVRVFGKSLYVLAAGWIVAVGWLWVAAVRQSLSRQDAWPDGYGLSMLVAGALPALALVGLARWLGRLSQPTPNAREDRREWRHAFWWSLVPNVMLLITAWLMIQAAW
jgi:hypothetical protein